MDHPDKIAAQNLALWHAAATETRELCILQAREMGRRFANAKNEGEPSAKPTPASLLAADDTADVPLSHFMSVGEQLAFCRGILDVSPDFQKDGEQPLPTPPAAPRVAFLDGFFSRAALRRFEKLLPHPRTVTAASFTAVCEELASDNADLALLPLEDSSEGKFLHLFEEIERFELHISHVCDIPYPDEGRTVRIGLLSRLYTPRGRVTGEHLLALSAFEETPRTLPDLLQAAEESGLSLKRIGSLPAPYGEDGLFYHPVFRTREESAPLFELFLSLFMPRIRITGRYLHLKSKGEQI